MSKKKCMFKFTPGGVRNYDSRIETKTAQVYVDKYGGVKTCYPPLFQRELGAWSDDDIQSWLKSLITGLAGGMGVHVDLKSCRDNAESYAKNDNSWYADLGEYEQIMSDYPEAEYMGLDKQHGTTYTKKFFENEVPLKGPCKLPCKSGLFEMAPNTEVYFKDLPMALQVEIQYHREIASEIITHARVNLLKNKFEFVQKGVKPSPAEIRQVVPNSKTSLWNLKMKEKHPEIEESLDPSVVKQAGVYNIFSGVIKRLTEGYTTSIQHHALKSFHESDQKIIDKKYRDAETIYLNPICNIIVPWKEVREIKNVKKGHYWFLEAYCTALYTGLCSPNKKQKYRFHNNLQDSEYKNIATFLSQDMDDKRDRIRWSQKELSKITNIKDRVAKMEKDNFSFFLKQASVYSSYEKVVNIIIKELADNNYKLFNMMLNAGWIVVDNKTYFTNADQLYRAWKKQGGIDALCPNNTEIPYKKLYKCVGDHDKPQSKGGTTTEDNLIVTTPQNNLQKGNMTTADYKELKRREGENEIL